MWLLVSGVSMHVLRTAIACLLPASHLTPPRSHGPARGPRMGEIPRPTLAEKINAACTELAVEDESLTLSEALLACNEALGIKGSGPLLAQADELVSQLGINLAPPAVAVSTPAAATVAGATRSAARKKRPPMPQMVVFDLDFTLVSCSHARAETGWHAATRCRQPLTARLLFSRSGVRSFMSSQVVRHSHLL